MSPEDEVEEILRQFSSAPDEDHKTEVLSRISPLLSNPEARVQYKSALESVDINIIFSCIESTSTDSNLELIANVLTKVLDLIDPVVALEKYEGRLYQFLSEQSKSAAKLIAIKFLKRCSQKALETLWSRKSLLEAATRALVSPDTDVVKEVKALLQEFSKVRRSSLTDEGLGTPPPLLLDDPILPVMEELKQHENDVIKFRAIEVMLSAGKMSPAVMALVAKASFLDTLVSMVLRDDVLVQLNALEIMADFSQSPHGFAFLMEQGVLSDLEALMNKPSSHHLLPGFVKFFGRLCHHDPTNFLARFPTFTSMLTSLINEDSGDQDLHSLAISTVGHIGISLEGKRKVKTLLGKTFFTALSNYLQYGKMETKVMALETLADLISTPDLMEDLGNYDEAIDTTKEFFDQVSSRYDVMGRIMNIITQPFGEMWTAGYHLLSNMADKPWGLKNIMQQPGMIEKLLDRHLSLAGNEAKLTKFHLIKIISENPASAEPSAVPSELLVRIRRYVNEGPYYVEPEVAVAIDEN